MRTWIACWLVVLSAAATGCGRSDIERVVVRGKVAFNDLPIENGEIRFFPMGDTQMPMSGAPIVNGQYVVEHRGGVPVGDFRVEIEGFRKSAANPQIDIEGGHREQFVPLKYNAHSELTIQVTGDAPEMEKDFLDLRS